VDPATRRELVVINGLGESPGAVVYHPSARLLIASPTEGILEINASTRSITRGPGNGIKPGGDGITALALDPRGRVYAVAARGCAGGAGVVHVLNAPPDYGVIRTVPVGNCPTAATLAFRP
jgi:streptogramin lyase